eukprot:snap_masked-scaffold_2-processed-gene-18.46-mRNA-1 protein AED:1.00 eAED:1.00 QI:0/-1/0/0/-1/1/1/0/97
MLETLQNYVRGYFKDLKKSSHYFMNSEMNKKCGIEAVKLQRCEIICTSSKNPTCEVNLNFYMKKKTCIFKVIDLEHVGNDFRKISTVKKYLTDLTEA